MKCCDHTIGPSSTLALEYWLWETRKKFNKIFPQTTFSRMVFPTHPIKVLEVTRMRFHHRYSGSVDLPSSPEGVSSIQSFRMESSKLKSPEGILSRNCLMRAIVYFGGYPSLAGKYYNKLFIVKLVWAQLLFLYGRISANQLEIQ